MGASTGTFQRFSLTVVFFLPPVPCATFAFFFLENNLSSPAPHACSVIACQSFSLPLEAAPPLGFGTEWSWTSSPLHVIGASLPFPRPPKLLIDEIQLVRSFSLCDFFGSSLLFSPIPAVLKRRPIQYIRAFLLVLIDRGVDFFSPCSGFSSSNYVVQMVPPLFFFVFIVPPLRRVCSIPGHQPPGRVRRFLGPRLPCR